MFPHCKYSNQCNYHQYQRTLQFLVNTGNNQIQNGQTNQHQRIVTLPKNTTTLPPNSTKEKKKGRRRRNKRRRKGEGEGEEEEVQRQEKVPNAIDDNAWNVTVYRSELDRK